MQIDLFVFPLAHSKFLRESDGFLSVCYGLAHGEFYPPGCVITEFCAFGWIIFSDCANKSGVSFRDQFCQIETQAQKTVGNFYNKTQIR